MFKIKMFNEYINEINIGEVKITISKKTVYHDLFVTLIEFLFKYFSITNVNKFKIKIMNPNLITIGSINLGSKFKHEIEITESMPLLMIKAIIHEFTHFKQILKNELYLDGDFICMGDYRISISDYNKISQKSNDIYSNLPWELEADKNMKIINDEFFKSQEFINFGNSNAINKFIFDNLI